MTLSELQQWLESYAQYGPLPGFIITFIESFFPPLPLNVLIAINANVYGLWEGSLYSWLGSSLGSFFVFLLFRKLGWKFRDRVERRFAPTRKVFDWIEHFGFTPIFLLSCFPFSPTVIVTFVSAICHISLRKFLVAVLLGKAIMIVGVSAVTYDIEQLASNPWRILLLLGAIVLMWLGGRTLERMYNKAD